MATYTSMPENITHTGAVTGAMPGSIAPADSPAFAEASAGGPAGGDQTATVVQPGLQVQPGPVDYGPNNERMEQISPRLVNALRELVAQFRQEGSVARRHEIRRIRQARLFWQGLQYGWWNPQEMRWHLPSEANGLEGASADETPRYQFVTNLYQAFGLSFIAVISQDVPTTRFFPQSTMSDADISTAKAASEVAELVEQNNRVQQLLTGLGFYLWTDGKIGGYVRYVADGQRFGWRDELVLEERYVRLGSDVYLCPQCGYENPASTQPANSVIPRSEATRNLSQNETREGFLAPLGMTSADNNARNEGGSFLAGAICENCGAALSAADFRPAPLVPVPVNVSTRRVPNGQEVISIVGGLELNTPVWANEQHEFPYLQWQMEVHSAKLRAAFPHAAEEIAAAGSVAPDDTDARNTRVAVAQGLSGGQPGDTLFNLVTFSRTWIRPWSFYAIEDAAVRDALLAQFPDGCYVAFAGDTYCESRNESMDDCWRVMHALPGDGQNRPSVGDSLIQIQERYNTLSNIQAETYEYGIPPIYADPQVLDFDALAGQTAEPAAHYPARARPGMALADGFFQPLPAQVPPDMLRHQQDLAGPIAQFLTGLFPAVFGGEMSGVRTASGYAMARDQALGRLGLVWRRLKQFYADMMLLSVDCFRKNRPSDVEIPFLGASGEFQARFIRLADLRGNIQTHAEADETFPRLKSQQRAVLQQLMANPDPTVQATLREPANLGFIKSLIGLNELVVPGEDARTKQLREIQQLLTAAPILTAQAPLTGDLGLGAPIHPGVILSEAKNLCSASDETAQRDSSARQAGPQNDNAQVSGTHFISTVPVDELLDDHAAEFEECRRWASSDAGQQARTQNPAGFANVRAHAAEHAAVLARLAQGAQDNAVIPSGARNPSASSASVRSTAKAQRPEFHTTSATAELQTTSSKAYPPKGSGDHWVTIDGKPVLIRESQGTRNQESPQSPAISQARKTPQQLAVAIPPTVRAEMAKAIDDSKGPTADDKEGGFHEESGVAGTDASGDWVVSRNRPGPYGNPDVDKELATKEQAMDQDRAYSIVDPQVFFHVHPSGRTTAGKHWKQPPSDIDKAGALPLKTYIIFAAGEKKVYFYDSSGILGQPMSLKDFLEQ